MLHSEQNAKEQIIIKRQSIVSDQESDTDHSTADSDVEDQVTNDSNESSQGYSSTSDADEPLALDQEEENTTVFKRDVDTSTSPASSQPKRQRILSSWDRKKILTQTASGDFMYKFCPVLNKEQQYKVEYSLPLVIPVWFALANLTKVAFYWGFVIVIGHTIETYLTSFGPSSDPNTKVFDAMSHHMMDCFWLQTLITGMVIKPELFATSEFKVYLIAALTTILLPIYLSVSYKTYYCMNTNVKEKSPMKDSTIGQHVQSCFLWYGTAAVLLCLGYESSLFVYGGVVALNVSPFVLTKNFLRTFDDLKEVDTETADLSSESTPLL
ncbi:hypothetical protein CTEN210_01578 [Chaetoceros tenuissimus]|uniref:Uncharacterized protein n=1 Tax=Chaetoceros tenuissimus TaxID=426638 RepID=A0AAD3CHV9_9STRA|nr:hypothetical protein CTEN210_01578 [Chaetoceros tenuissimus]